MRWVKGKALQTMFMLAECGTLSLSTVDLRVPKLGVFQPGDEVLLDFSSGSEEPAVRIRAKAYVKDCRRRELVAPHIATLVLQLNKDQQLLRPAMPRDWRQWNFWHFVVGWRRPE